MKFQSFLQRTLATLMLVALSATAQPYSLDWYAIGNAGGTGGVGSLSVADTAGQPATGSGVGGNLTLTSGFWSLYGTTPTVVYGLWTYAIPLQAGTVTVDPNTGTYAPGATVTLTPNRNVGWLLNGWSGDAGGADNPLLVSMTDNKSIDANFQPTLVVANTNDNGPGSLRQAIADASLSPTKVLTFGAGFTGTILLTNGGLTIGSDLTIVGSGANLLTIDGGGTNVVLTVSGGNVSVSGLTFAHGTTGVVNTNASLTLSNCFITGNAIRGLVNGTNGTMVLIGCTVASNLLTTSLAVTGHGAGINNAASSSVMALTNCTVSDNLLVATVDANIFSGAGVANSGSLIIMDSTITGNSLSNSLGGGNLRCGGIWGNATIGNSIVAGNSDKLGMPDWVGSALSLGYNLIGSTNGSTGWGTNDLVGSTTSLLDPKLGPLQNNGGPTPTHALLPNSPAIDQGSSGVAVQQNSGPYTTGGPDDWQSFTALISGPLARVGIGTGNSPTSPSSSPGTLSIYAGEGTGGALLASTSVTFADMQGLQVFTLPSPPQVLAGNQYTIRFTVPSAPYAWVLVDISNPYPGGRSSSGANYDYVFSAYVPQLTTDQRGQPRPYDISSIPNAGGGDGSDIGAFELIPPPLLSAVCSGNSVIISWPSNVGNYYLEQKSDLAIPGGWVRSDYSIATTNGTNSVSITPAIGNQFFRLHLP